MSRNGGPPREVAVPIGLFSALRSELEAETGTLPTVRALHQAGYRAGKLAAAPLQREAGGALFDGSQAAFWSQVRRYFRTRGWGTLEHREPHTAVGLLTSRDWAEAEEGEPDPDASCCFSTGFLSGLLSEIVGGPIAVLEVECRTRGADRCDFAFGSEGAIHELYGRLLEGEDLETALSAL